MRYVWIALVAAGCGQDLQFVGRDKVPPAEPPGEEEDTKGDPPDWQNCFQGWRGVYTNLSVHDEFVAPRPDDPPAPTEPEGFDYWDKPIAYEEFDPTLDFGQNWWPVDEELEGDPKYFAVHWDAWIRAWSDTNLSFTLGSQDDAWVYVNEEPIASRPGIQAYVREPYDVWLEAGQYPIEVWFVHRGSESSGFSFRVLSGDVSVCYPDFGTPQ
jgi:hypothetical protein